MNQREKVLSRRVPVAQSILWKPLDDSYYLLVSMLRRTTDLYALFVTQRFLLTLDDQMQVEPEQDVLGLVIGGLYRCPRSGVRYCVFEKAVSLPDAGQLSQGHTDLRQLQGVLNTARAKQNRQTLGWYSRRSEIGRRLLPSDERIHVACFDQTWHTAVVVAPSAGSPVGAFFQYDSKAGRSYTAPFYELVKSGFSGRQSRKHTLINWYNYVTAEAVTPLTVKGRERLQVQPDEGAENGGHSFGGMLTRVRHWVSGNGTREQVPDPAEQD